MKFLWSLILSGAIACVCVAAENGYRWYEIEGNFPYHRQLWRGDKLVGEWNGYSFRRYNDKSGFLEGGSVNPPIDIPIEAYRPVTIPVFRSSGSC